MTKEQIKDLVAAKIAGQGSMVDVGGGLPTIFNEIIDLIPEGGGGGFEPLVIEGRVDEGDIIIDDSDSYDEAVDKFCQGFPVVITFEYQDVTQYEAIIAFDDHPYTKNFTVYLK